MDVRVRAFSDRTKFRKPGDPAYQATKARIGANAETATAIPTLLVLFLYTSSAEAQKTPTNQAAMNHNVAFG
jgi:hypothetical protein